MAEIVDLHEYFTVCAECEGITWYIQWTRDCNQVMQIVCANPECSVVVENPGLSIECELH